MELPQGWLVRTERHLGGFIRGSWVFAKVLYDLEHGHFTIVRSAGEPPQLGEQLTLAYRTGPDSPKDEIWITDISPDPVGEGLIYSFRRQERH